MSLDDVAAKIRQKAAQSQGLRARVLFDFGDDGCLHVDATDLPALITTEAKDADVTLTTSLETFEKILSGETDPNFAFLMGKLKVQGSMGLAMKLNAFLEG